VSFLSAQLASFPFIRVTLDKLKNFNFKQEIKRAIEPVQQRESQLKESINVHVAMLEKLNSNGNTAISKIRESFSRIRANIDKRENELLSEVEEKIAFSLSSST